MSIAVYWETWSGKNLLDIDPAVSIVYLAFADPKTTYKSGSYKFDGTGLDFNESFDAIKSKITTLSARGTKVILSVGGASYKFPNPFDATASVALMKDLGCAGIDIDWEPDNGIQSAGDFGPLIGEFRRHDDKMYLSAACWSVGAFGPKQGNDFFGLNIPGMETNGGQLSWINIMAYDAGPGFDAVGALECYRIYYKGPLLVGIQLGTQGWGGGITTDQDIKKVLAGAKRDGNAGIFIWSYNKDTTGSPTVAATIIEAKSVLGNTLQKPPPPKSSTSPFALTCPNCSKKLVGEISF